MVYSKTVKKAIHLACQAHMDQKDQDGYPYIFHVIHVAEQMDTEDETIVALLHDVLEDSKNINEKILIDKGIPMRLIGSLMFLKHDGNIPYFDYIERIKTDPIARKVKLIDLYHNSDLPRLHKVTGDDIKRVEKYKKAIKILENTV